MSLSLSSTAREVQEFLISRGFDETIRINFKRFTGDAILGATEAAIIRRCGDEDEGDRLWGILNSIRQSLTELSKLHYFLFIYVL